MKTRFASLALLATSALVSVAVSATANQKLPPVVGKPMFVVLPSNAPGHQAPVYEPGKTLTQWNGSFTDSTKRTFHFVMAAEDPSKSNGTTDFAVMIIPVALVFGKDNGKETFDPTVHVVKGTNSTVMDLTLNSPIFKSNVDFKQGGTDLGQTQYIDAFQRGTFWGSVRKHKNYHVILNPISVAKLQTINVAASEGQVHALSDGTHVGQIDINAFDSRLQSFMRAVKVKPNMLPIFVTYNTYQTFGNNGPCCVGGYHSANGSAPKAQTYAQATFVDGPGHFAEDVSALSHEVGEWMDDPFGNNRVVCHDDNTNGFLEVGDPLESGFPNFGAFPYAVNGYTYNLQSLAFMTYFGAPKKTSLHGWYSFQNDMKHVCPGE